jgi:hypothetical protein
MFRMNEMLYFVKSNKRIKEKKEIFDIANFFNTTILYLKKGEGRKHANFL